MLRQANLNALHNLVTMYFRRKKYWCYFVLSTFSSLTTYNFLVSSARTIWNCLEITEIFCLHTPKIVLQLVYIAYWVVTMSSTVDITLNLFLQKIYNYLCAALFLFWDFWALVLQLVYTVYCIRSFFFQHCIIVVFNNSSNCNISSIYVALKYDFVLQGEQTLGKLWKHLVVRNAFTRSKELHKNWIYHEV